VREEDSLCGVSQMLTESFSSIESKVSSWGLITSNLQVRPLTPCSFKVAQGQSLKALRK
jgi:hypothetical protein